MAEAPYSNEFIDLIVEIIEPIAESLDKAMEVKTVVWEFLSTLFIYLYSHKGDGNVNSIHNLLLQILR
jgi:hypothetical protein